MASNASKGLAVSLSAVFSEDVYDIVFEKTGFIGEVDGWRLEASVCIREEGVVAAEVDKSKSSPLTEATSPGECLIIIGEAGKSMYLRGVLAGVGVTLSLFSSLSFCTSNSA